MEHKYVWVECTNDDSRHFEFIDQSGNRHLVYNTRNELEVKKGRDGRTWVKCVELMRFGGIVWVYLPDEVISRYSSALMLAEETEAVR